HRERGDDLQEVPEAGGDDQQTQQEEDVVVAGEDVLDAEAEELADRVEAATGDGFPQRQLDRLAARTEDVLAECPAGAGPILDACQRPVPRVLASEEVHGDAEPVYAHRTPVDGAQVRIGDPEALPDLHVERLARTWASIGLDGDARAGEGAH